MLRLGLTLLVRTLARRLDRLAVLGNRLTATAPAAWISRHFPAQLAWVRRRLDPRSATGLALSAVVTVAALGAWMFAGLTQDVVAHDEVVRLDPEVQAFALTHRTGWLTAFMQAVTWLGSSVILVAVLLGASGLLLGRRRDWRASVQLWAALVGAAVLYGSAKVLVDRARPPATEMITHATGWSYPSGHATQAIAVWGMLAFVLLPGRSPRVRTVLLATAVIVVLLVGASRIYLGAHWLTDVLGGYALGGTWLGLLLALRLRGMWPLVTG